MPPEPLEDLCFALRSVRNGQVQLNILWPYNFTYGQSNLHLIGHSVQAIIYSYIVLCYSIMHVGFKTQNTTLTYKQKRVLL